MKIIKLCLVFSLIFALIGCQTSEAIIENNNNIVIIREEEGSAATIEGTIEEINDGSILIKNTQDEPYVIHINDMTYDQVSEKFLIGNKVSIGFSGEVMESYPMQINGEILLSNEFSKQSEISGTVKSVDEKALVIEDHDGDSYEIVVEETTFDEGVSEVLEKGNEITLKISGELAINPSKRLKEVIITTNVKDRLITLDPREMVSGLIHEFPNTIITDFENTIAINSVFAISLVNETDDSKWQLITDDQVLEPTGDGIKGSKHYFGFRADLVGSFELTFSQFGSSDQIIQSKTYTITIK